MEMISGGWKSKTVVSGSLKAIAHRRSAQGRDGSAGGIEPNAITFELCQHYVDQYILVNEEEIANAILLMLEKHHMVVEGAAGVTVSAYLKEKDRFKEKNVVLIICGGNISIQQLKEIICNRRS